MTGFHRAFDDACKQFAREAGEAPQWVTLAAPLIERFEGLARQIPGDKVTAYQCSAGVWTIGIGSTTDENGNPVKNGDVWSIERARKRFDAQLREFGQEVDRLIAGKPTTPAQKAALTSLAYNIGHGALSRSTALKRHRAGDYSGAAEAFKMWNRAGGRVVRGLVRRREAEAELYLS